MTVFARTYHPDGDVTEIVEHTDGRVGIWSPINQSWVTVWGLGRNQAGFRNAIVDAGNLTEAGKKLLGAWKQAVRQQVSR